MYQSIKNKVLFAVAIAFLVISTGLYSIAIPFQDNVYARQQISCSNLVPEAVL